MWRLLVVGSLLAAPAAAEPRHCDPAGGVLFEIDQRAAGKRTTATTLLYGNGAWRSKTFDTDGKLADTEHGCLEHEHLERIVAALRGATWKVTHTAPTCALSPRWSTFTWKARRLFTERACSGDALDADSAKALDLIQQYVVPVDLDDASRPRGAGHVSQQCLNDPLADGCR